MTVKMDTVGSKIGNHLKTGGVCQDVEKGHIEPSWSTGGERIFLES